MATPELDRIVADPPTRFVAASAEQGAVIDEWWRRFGDDQLNGYVERAAVYNPQILQAVARVEQARAQARVARADLYPQLGVGLNASRQRQNLAGSGFGALLGGGTPGAGAGGGTGDDGGAEGGEGEGDEASATAFTTDSFSLTGNVSWTIDLWGRIASQTAAARAEFLASEENLRAVRQAIAAQVAQSYFGLVEAQQQVKVAEQLETAIAEVARQVGNRVDVGIAPPNDKTLAFANLGQARASLAQRREALQRATRNFDQLIRAYPDGAVAAAEVLPEVPPPPPAGLPAQLLARRPDVREAELRLVSAGYREAAAERALLPNIDLTGSAGTSSSELGDLLNGDFFIWSIAGQLLQPIFQGGRLRAQVDLAEGRKAEAVEAYAETVLQALSEVETALAVEAELARRQAALRAATEAAQASVTISFNRYRAGIDPFATVLQSQQNALDASSAYVAATRARLDNRIALHLALGGGFEQAPMTALPQD
ncbi:efflux transporter outer membrane subunit [Novosphingobium sp. M1R2S20]|uniref:Efflux transporter outer membrane subunit n=1 Tax=Novosphingobium rhizovicinum TaxID=3228928 RepID=A0ABV3REW1_9SPHN